MKCSFSAELLVGSEDDGIRKWRQLLKIEINVLRLGLFSLFEGTNPTRNFKR